MQTIMNGRQVKILIIMCVFFSFAENEILNEFSLLFSAYYCLSFPFLLFLPLSLSHFDHFSFCFFYTFSLKLLYCNCYYFYENILVTILTAPLHRLPKEKNETSNTTHVHISNFMIIHMCVCIFP